MPTNQEWLHKLANESPDELKAWFDAEHNDNLAAEKVVSCDVAYSNDGNAHSTTGNMTEQSESLSDAFSDSREKLEADVYNHIAISITPNKEDDGVLAPYTTVLEWLDRQAAITEHQTERKWCCYEGSAQAEIDRLQRRNDELRTSYDKLKRERDELRGSLDTAKQLIEQYKADGVDNLRKIDELTDELAKRDKGIERLKRQRDEARDFLTSSENLNANLSAMNDALADDNDRIEAERDKLKTYVDDATADYAKLVKERDNLAADLLTCNREREQLRKHLGIALDHAHDICSLVDIDGNVLDVGD